MISEKIAIIGLGYVGLPLALALGKRFEGVIGYDRNPARVGELGQGVDRNAESSADELKQSALRYTASIEDLRGASFFIIAVPTPVDENNQPDLEPLLSACALVGQVLARGSVVVFESTVYPGVTEDICGEKIAEVSGLKKGVDFSLAYSPERINPGDREHRLESIVKVVSADSAQALQRVEQVYGRVIDAGLCRASSIKVAEAAKVIENTQRDLNIALMNELAIIFNRMGIATRDVLQAARSKWNFLPFVPGLVGGHCIGVDPYYLTTLAQKLGYHPEVILAGRRINDGMGRYIAQQTVKLLVNSGFSVRGAKVGLLGVTFKENVSDIRNSRVPDIIKELSEFGVESLVHDPVADRREVFEEYGVSLMKMEELKDLEAVIVAVPHDYYRSTGPAAVIECLKPSAVVVDVKWLFKRQDFPEQLSYWSL